MYTSYPYQINQVAGMLDHSSLGILPRSMIRHSNLQAITAVCALVGTYITVKYRTSLTKNHRQTARPTGHHI